MREAGVSAQDCHDITEFRICLAILPVPLAQDIALRQRGRAADQNTLCFLVSNVRKGRGRKSFGAAITSSATTTNEVFAECAGARSPSTHHQWIRETNVRCPPQRATANLPLQLVKIYFVRADPQRFSNLLELAQAGLYHVDCEHWRWPGLCQDEEPRRRFHELRQA
jgi:hypothetical protein